ncbi:uncharacterized protein LOC117651211 [Thrips palmi]|uniref:Uncharacterized protein LOC117651211 n=1 Tax=Thrips palmi TaxID=161013 RepID=A0A6P9A0G1_THRPL|nr:uncharacterized protein LOC117651211 [Thrips palmi]
MAAKFVFVVLAGLIALQAVMADSSSSSSSSDESDKRRPAQRPARRPAPARVWYADAESPFEDAPSDEDFWYPEVVVRRPAGGRYAPLPRARQYQPRRPDFLAPRQYQNQPRRPIVVERVPALPRPVQGPNHPARPSGVDFITPNQPRRDSGVDFITPNQPRRDSGVDFITPQTRLAVTLAWTSSPPTNEMSILRAHIQ